MQEPAPSQPVAAGPRALHLVLLRLLVQGLVAASVLAVAFDLWRRFDAADVRLELGWLAAALVPALLGVVVQAFGWRSLLVRLVGRELSWVDTLAIYLDAQMARYTPGKVGLLAVRIAAAPKLGVSTRLMVGSLLIELLSWTGMGILVGCLTVAVTWSTVPARVASWTSISPHLVPVMATLSSLALFGLLVLCGAPRSRFPAWVQKVLAVPEADSNVDRPLLPVALPAWHALHWACWVLAGGILCLGVGASVAVAAFSGGVLCLAVVLGFLAVVAPAGAGVREVVISVGTAPVLGPSAAVVLGLTARVVSLVADFTAWSVARLLVLKRAR